jgi:uncharacterized membrane protein YhaH (DUF805 family)
LRLPILRWGLIMNFMEAVSSVFRNYVGFSGRASRSEYWYWILFTVIVSVCLSILDRAIFPDMAAASPLASVFTLATLLPGLAVAARRLHDIDRTGWWILIALTVIGGILLLVWFCQRGTPGPNRFGPDSLAGTV